MDPYTIAEQSYKNGFAAARESIPKCASCEYWWLNDGSPESDAPRYCLKHQRITAPDYFCKDATQEWK